MADVEKFTFSHKELAGILVKHLDLHEGIWGLYVEFGLKATNIATSEDTQIPAAVVPLLKLGLQKFEKETTLSADASKVNPRPGPKPKRKSR